MHDRKICYRDLKVTKSLTIHRTEKDGGCTFYHNYLANLTEPLAHIESHILCMQGLKFSDLF